MTRNDFRTIIRAIYPDKEIDFSSNEVQHLAIIREGDSTFRFWSNLYSEVVHGQMDNGAMFQVRL